MGIIKILDESVSNVIAAGEVVENPASMIKEMVENSLDAKATMIKIEVFKSGVDVKISDNGIGMDKEDTLLSVERHATSKIEKKEDVFNLNTYGFRGEALSSIAAVSKLTILTRTKESLVGYKISSYGGVVRKFEEVSKNVGTEVEVRDLFYNTPARKKFLRKASTEYSKIREIVLREALANSSVAFSLDLDGKNSIRTSGKGMENTILELFGKSVLRNLKKFEYGYLGNVEILRSTKDFLFTFVNNRYVKSLTIERAIIDGYYTKLMKGKYPFAIIFYNTDPKEIDVNVHPSKKIVKFSNDKIVYSEIKSAIDDFFYYADRENWQPNIDLIKKNINLNEKNSTKNDLFASEVPTVEENKFLSLETFDGKIESEEKNKEKKDDKRNEENKELKNFSQDDRKNNETKENNKFKNMSKLEPERIFNKGQNKNSNLTEFYKKDEDKIFSSKNFESEKTEKVKGEVPYKNDEILEINQGGNSNYKVGTFEKKVGLQVEYDVLGQIFDTYILVKKDNELEIYDQHIIHERILYEELKEKFYGKKIDSIQLLIPKKMEVTQIEKEIIFENIEIFNNFGFEIDEFYENEILIRAVPIFDFRDSAENVFEKLLSDLKNEVEIKDLREKIIISMSCRGAVKAGQKLSFDEMQNMVRRIHEVGKYTCPHGRPIIVKLTKNDLDKMFGRRK
ncbi:DNA mismatch repair endonuclease MutL [Leptotrichia sp. oral taxon 847]|uniref:DNA mismatch repair endonuclease MutL n=1 Tax=Leptotrichia sp. oral taxon 847 TaxID=1785996 RepID=UPI0007683F38|nr:DNA mismatch repair endonuclease MutL [Leptotrichia sp. oral taxon 847]AMD94946.1 DNA mismatch repair protein MutL [Leptotrichia sp. oral taxon 847]